jgi:hypothetical protein
VYVVAAALAVTTHEANRDVAARQVVHERVDHLFRERRRVGTLGVREEGREVHAEDAVVYGVVRPAGSLVFRRSEG